LQRRVPSHRRRDGRAAGQSGLPLRADRAPRGATGCGGTAPARDRRAAGGRRDPDHRRRPGRGVTAADVAADQERLDYARAAIEYAYDQGWSDGLPVVPVTRPVVEEFLAQTSRPADSVVAAVPHLGRECTVEQAAVNAALAGCRPEYFPVVLAAWEALGRDRAVTGGGWQSTSGPAPLII